MPIMILPAIETLSNTSAVPSFESSTCNDLHHCRTIWNIIWSCLVTLFACIWLSIHMNIPSPNDRWGTRLARRTWVMVLALLAPEFIVGWAVRQLIEAVRVKSNNKAYKWTTTHGFFVVMGGFLECNEDGEDRTLDHDHENDIPAEVKEDITEGEIQDRSKGDVLSKGFALLQTGWFILQCISRKLDHLPVTQLEVATVAFAVLNFATYIAWWDKPLNVNKPVRVRRSRPTGKGSGKNEEMDEEAGWWKWPKTWVRETWEDLNQGPKDFVREVYRSISGIRSELKKRSGRWSSKFLYLAVPFAPIAVGYRATEGNDQKRVGIFSPSHNRLERSFVASIGVGMVFGAIHCLAWDFDFPSRKEQVIWWISAVSVTGAPPLVALALHHVGAFDNLNYVMKGRFLTLFVCVPLTVLYFFARVALLVLPFMSLRSLPSGAYRTADWTRFIPHI